MRTKIGPYKLMYTLPYHFKPPLKIIAIKKTFDYKLKYSKNFGIKLDSKHLYNKEKVRHNSNN